MPYHRPHYPSPRNIRLAKARIACLVHSTLVGIAAMLLPTAFKADATEPVTLLGRFVADGAGEWGNAPSFDADASAQTIPLQGSLDGGGYTLSAWIYLDRFIDEGKDGFSSVSPATIATLSDGENALVFFSIYNKRLRIAHRMVSGFSSLTGERELPLRTWVNVTAMADSSDNLRLFQNGVPDGATSGGKARFRHRIDRLQIGSFRHRALRGRMGALAFYDGSLDQNSISALAGADSATRMDRLLDTAATGRSAVPDVAAEEYAQRRLRVADDTRLPLAAGHLVRTALIPDGKGGLPRMMTQGRTFGASRIVFDHAPEGNREDTFQGQAVFDVGNGDFRPLLPHRQPGSNPPFFGLDTEGVEPGLILLGVNPLTNKTDLLRLRLSGEEGKDFEFAEALLCNGKTFSQAYPGARLSYVGRVDADEVPDLILVKTRSVGSYYPDAPDHFWVNRPLPNSGPGRGYSVNGKWLGGENIDTYYWAKGGLSADETLSFGPMKPIYFGDEDFIVQWKTYFYSNAGVINRDGQSYLIITGDLDKLLALPLREEDDALRCEEAIPLMADDAPIQNTYIIEALAIGDIDGDGEEEIVVSGNPGSVSVLKGSTVGQFVELPVVTRGGPLAMQTLIVPTVADWDGDGYEDIIAGDASGSLMCWPGTADPEVFGEPKYLTSQGERIHIQAGYHGSLQGPNEARWGYVNPLVCDWSGQGRLDLITSDINGDLLYWERNPQNPFDLLPARPFTDAGGKKLNLPWRQRPAFVSGDDPMAREGRPGLLVIDGEGDLALATPVATGKLSIESVEKIHYTDGETVLTCGPVGAWGRGKFCWVDWDGDGRRDLLFGTNRINNIFFSDEAVEANSMPFVFRNEGSEQSPRLARPRPLHLDGKRLNFGTHITAMWPLFAEGGAIPSALLIGAEDGRIYRFEREELIP
ncbi:VCBS repeat-containing protein [Ruficoccus amylovorans]|uniref:VCBS repeat-containing protein n=1 Tax=Ruficoccus amylovorans TaxID=1804625 RepID=A0A842HL23_9BACT|nr:FG-GAP-like repeat-containing protein [Ruficoccus amylovorans]MBC2596384.1 VCBS repeat-containing protein [Ruficoccus amylovorans]